jgi:ATP-dependent Lon protease
MTESNDTIKKINALKSNFAKLKNINSNTKTHYFDTLCDMQKKIESQNDKSKVAFTSAFSKIYDNTTSDDNIKSIEEEYIFLKEINKDKKLASDYNKYCNSDDIPSIDDIIKIKHISFSEKKYLIDMINMYNEIEPHHYDDYREKLSMRDEIIFKYTNIISIKKKEDKEKYKRAREINIPTYNEILADKEISDEGANYLIDKLNKTTGSIGFNFDEGMRKLKKFRTELDMKGDFMQSEMDIIKKLHISQLPKDYKSKLHQKLSQSDEFDKPKIMELVSQAISLPYNKKIYDIPKKMDDFCVKFKKILDEELYGLSKVKEEIITSICCKVYTSNSKHKAIALVGPPGTGKTSIARAVSRIFNIPFEQISMNTVSSGSDLTGHNYTYVGSQPGRIAKALMNMKCNNGVLFLDEIDKVNNNSSDSAVNTLMNICDFTQNTEFTDNYFGELKIDLSNLFIICSLNDITKMNYVLTDRIKLIQINGYTTEEKFEIAKKIISKTLKELELKDNDINISDEIIKFIIIKDNEINSMSNDCDSSGVRGIENIIKHILERLKIMSNSTNKEMSYYIHNLKLPYSLTLDDCKLLLMNYGTTGKGQMDILESINNSNLPAINKQELRLNLANTNDKSHDYGKVIEFIKQAVKLPFNKKNYDMPQSTTELYFKFKKTLDNELFGMEKVKEELITTLCCKFKTPSSKNKVIALVGSPGTGKTTIARSIAKVFDLPFEQISVNSLENSSDLTGHNYTYVGSQPGRIAKCLIKMGCNNGVLFLDEIDKLSSKKKDIEDALMNILDYSQNNEFTDNYFQNIKLNLSNLTLVCSLNNISKLDTVLADRVKFIHVDDYTLDEKINIGKNMKNKIMSDLNIIASDILISNQTMKYIIKLVEENENRIGKLDHGGVRSLESILRHIFERTKILIDMKKENCDFKNITFNLDRFNLPHDMTQSDIDILTKNYMAKKDEISLNHMYL